MHHLLMQCTLIMTAINFNPFGHVLTDLAWRDVEVSQCLIRIKLLTMHRLQYMHISRISGLPSEGDITAGRPHFRNFVSPRRIHQHGPGRQRLDRCNSSNPKEGTHSVHVPVVG